MPTRRQHTLPRFLLAGFASRDALTWYFQKDQQPVETSLTNVAVRRDFYGRVEDTGLETAFSAKESQHASFLRQVIRDGGCPEEAAPLAADFVTNIMLRSSHLRAALVDAHGSLENLLDSDEVTEEFLRLLFEAAPRQVRKVLGLGPDDPIPEEFRWIVEDLSKADIKRVVKPFLDGLRSIPREEIAFDAHVKALLRNPGNRVRLYSRLRWTIVRDLATTLVLGDVGPLASYDGGASFLLPVKENTLPDLLCLPVSNRHLLIGQRPGPVLGPVESNHINRATAELSASFFVASQNTRIKNALHAVIGTRFRLMELADMSSRVRDAFRGLRHTEDW